MMGDVEEPLIELEAPETPTGLQLFLESPETLEHAGATVPQTVFNLINIFMGLALLSIPYAMRLSGWAGLASMVLAAGLFCLSGKLIIAAFDRVPASKPRRYSELGKAALGQTGKWLVVILASCEMFGASCLSEIVIWKQIEAFLPGQGILGLSSLHVAASVATAFLVPLLFIPSLRQLSHLSWLGFVSTVVVMLAVMASTIIDPHRRAEPIQPAPGHELFNWSIIQAFGIFALSLSGHSGLPAVRSSMAEPQRFSTVLNISFTAMLVIYSAVAGLGYYYYGNETEPLITTDLALKSPLSGQSILFRGFTLDKIVNVFIAMNAYTTCPLVVVILQDTVLGVLPQRYRVVHHPALPYMLRVAIFSAAAMLSLWAWDYLGMFMSLIGGVCSLSCSIVLPTLFFTCLYWRELSSAGRLGVVALQAVSVTLLISVVSADVRQLIQQLHRFRIGVGSGRYKAV